MSETKTDAELAIQCLIRGTISRAYTESTACIVVLIAFAWILQSCDTGSPSYYGCLLTLIATGFIAGVVWSFTLGYKLLESHPVSDHGFWLAAFQTQVRLLRLVPLWYCAPVGAAIVLMVLPVESGMFGPLLLASTIPIGLFAFVIWLNRRAATELEKQSLLFSDQ